MKYKLEIMTDSAEELANLIKAGLPKAEKAALGNNRAGKANAKPTVKPEPKPEPKAEAVDTPTPPPAAEPSENGKPSAATLKALLQKRCAQYSLEAVGALVLDNFGVARFSQVPEEKHSELYQKLLEMGDPPSDA
jgi:hypothetical protein